MFMPETPLLSRAENENMASNVAANSLNLVSKLMGFRRRDMQNRAKYEG